MDLITPAIGLFFWTLVAFFLLLIILRAFAWKPILNAVNEREGSIEEAMNEAKKARQEIGDLKAENDQILKETRLERDAILKEARDLKDKMV
jgi:F-type H+-transporting ATPase subunit b